MMKIMMLLNKKGDIEDIEFGGKYGKVFECIHEFLEHEPEEWLELEKLPDGYDTIIDRTIAALNEAKEKKTFWDQGKEYKECAAAFIHALHFIMEHNEKI